MLKIKQYVFWKWFISVTVRGNQNEYMTNFTTTFVLGVTELIKKILQFHIHNSNYVNSV